MFQRVGMFDAWIITGQTSETTQVEKKKPFKLPKKAREPRCKQSILVRPGIPDVTTDTLINLCTKSLHFFMVEGLFQTRD